VLHVPGLVDPEFGDVGMNRRPVYLVLGEFRRNADQPLWFSRSKLFVDNKTDAKDNSFPLAAIHCRPAKVWLYLASHACFAAL